MTRQSDETPSAIGKWEVQVRKGVLEFVILLSLSEREQYGFELISGIARRAAIDVPEGTLYPLLLRLAKDGLTSLIHDARFRVRSGHLLRLAVLRGRPASLAFVSPHSD